MNERMVSEVPEWTSKRTTVIELLSMMRWIERVVVLTDLLTFARHTKCRLEQSRLHDPQESCL